MTSTCLGEVVKYKMIGASICGYYSYMVLEAALADKIISEGIYKEII